MKLWILTFAFLVGLSTPCRADNFRAENLHAIADVVRANAEYIRMIGEARLQWARAELIDAQTAEQVQRARALSLMVDRLELELRRLRADEYKLRQKIDYIHKHSKRVEWMVSGQTSQSGWQSLHMILREAFNSGATVDAMTMPVAGMRSQSFTTEDEQEYPLKEFTGGNVGQLLHFMQSNHYGFAPWGEAHVTVMKSLQKIGEASAKHAEQIRKHSEDLRRGTLDIWNPPAVKPMAKPEKPAGTGSETAKAETKTEKAGGELAAYSYESRPHAFCLTAKAGYEDCRKDGESAVQCQAADKGFKACRELGYAASFCVPAKSGFKACTDWGYTAEDCRTADSGFSDCMKEGFAGRDCIKAKAGYAACRAEGKTPAVCLTADKGFADCRADGNTGTGCLVARGTYKWCRDDGQIPSFCVTVGKGYQGCREAGRTNSVCKAADEGYKSCHSPL